MAKRITFAERRLREQRRKGITLMAVCISAFAALIGGAAWHDSRIGAAHEAELIGKCHGRLYAGMTREGFPRDCAWIEAIRESDK